jgi:erythromycin esterase
MGINATINEYAEIAKPFSTIKDLDQIIQKIKDKKIVMLGESTHGTSEFYRWRLEITKELVENHGFSFIAVEGDWPACQGINAFVTKNDLRSDPVEALKHFNRWPTWMWANFEMLNLLEWLSELNQNSLSDDDKVGFHGLDVYSLYESIFTINEQLEKVDPELAAKVMRFYSCFEPYQNDEKAYARSLYKYPDGCESDVADALFELFRKNITDIDILQNAKIIQQAERYYRSMITGEDSWNIRDQHMMSTLESLLLHYGSESKAIVWAHNTHIGDYRGTDMVFQGQVNIGGLAREKWGNDKVALIGFATYKGSVIASHAWDGKIENMEVPAAKEGSLEDILHQCVPIVGHSQFAFMLEDVHPHSILNDFRGHRAIGVVYHPKFEGIGNYVPTVLTQRYDGMIFFDETSALAPLQVEFDRNKLPETWPFGARV